MKKRVEYTLLTIISFITLIMLIQWSLCDASMRNCVDCNVLDSITFALSREHFEIIKAWLSENL